MNPMRPSLLEADDEDPMLSVVNLVDVFLVLVVALLTAVALEREAARPAGATPVQRAGEPDMEIVVREDGREVRLRGQGAERSGQGVRAGVAYRLATGEIIYVPEEAEATTAGPPAPAVAPRP